MSETLDIERLVVRYDGLDAAKHEIDLQALGVSIQGVARLVAVLGNFAATHSYVNRRAGHQVRVVAQGHPRPACIEVPIALQWAANAQVFHGAAGPLLAALVSWVFFRAKGSRDKAEMKHLSDALNAAIAAISGGHREQTSRLLDTIDRMANGLRPAVKQAVTPVGGSCRTMRLGAEGPVIDEATKAAIMADGKLEITPEQVYRVLITELDLVRRSCKVHFDGEGVSPKSRAGAQITDPAIETPENVYALAMAQGRWLEVKAKAAIRDGDLYRLYISDTV